MQNNTTLNTQLIIDVKTRLQARVSARLLNALSCCASVLRSVHRCKESGHVAQAHIYEALQE